MRFRVGVEPAIPALGRPAKRRQWVKAVHAGVSYCWVVAVRGADGKPVAKWYRCEDYPDALILWLTTTGLIEVEGEPDDPASLEASMPGAPA